MKILMVSHCFPWPADTGSRIRILGILGGLAQLGEVDLFVLGSGARTPSVPEHPLAARVEVGAGIMSGYRGLGRIRWAINGRLPLGIAGCDCSQVLDVFRSWRSADYDVAWCDRAISYTAVASSLGVPTIVDLDDLEDQKLLGLRNHPRALGANRLMDGWRSYRDRKNARLWTSFQNEIAAHVEAVVVTSELDRSRLGASNAVVIPNGFAAPERAVGKVHEGEPPTIVFQGLLTYEPNVDAAGFLVREVLPRLRDRLGQVRIRLVGRADQRVARLAEVPDVTVTGPVVRMSEELAKADLVLVPLRSGSGTRIKILEAFANGIPVVSTSLGAEGLDVRSGQHLLIADTPDDLALACAQILSDPALRGRLVGEAERLFEQRYRWDRIHEQISELVERVSSHDRSCGPSSR